LPILLVSLGGQNTSLSAKFERSEMINERKLPAGAGKPRTVTFTALEGLKKK